MDKDSPRSCPIWNQVILWARAILQEEMGSVVATINLLMIQAPSTRVSNTPATTKVYSEIVLASTELVKRKELIEEAQAKPKVASEQQQQILEQALMKVSSTILILDTMMATHHTLLRWSKANYQEEFFRQGN